MPKSVTGQFGAGQFGAGQFGAGQLGARQFGAGQLGVTDNLVPLLLSEINLKPQLCYFKNILGAQWTFRLILKL